MVEVKVPYTVDGRRFEGVLVYDEGMRAKRPAVFMQPDWKGVCADTIAQARAVAGKDYVVMMADMYGVGYGDQQRGLVDTGKIAGIGYCAGGGFVLEQARAAVNVNPVVVFHVTNPNPVKLGTPCHIKGRVLALHGSADPITPKSMMDALEAELTSAKVDWQITTFGGAVHSFCDPTANTDATRYDERLCRKSYAMMRDFFAETWG